MASAIVSVVIKSDRLHQRIPRIGQMVRVEGRTGLFVVMRVDRDRLVADLKQARNMLMLEENVPLKFLVPLEETVSEAIREFLTS